jgi:hypothetical protein
MPIEGMVPMLSSIVKNLLIFTAKIKSILLCDNMVERLILPFSSFDQIVKVINVGQMMLTMMVVKGFY